MKKHKIPVTILLATIIAITAPLRWLVLPLLLFVVSYLLIDFKDLSLKYRWIKGARKFVIIGGIFVLAITIRLCVFELYVIPSESMEDTLKVGDKILVNKLVYGPRLPQSPYDIPWFNLIWFLKANAATNTDSVYWDYCRLSGYSKIAKGDVAVFNHPLQKKRDNFFVKRCVAEPGDSIKIINGDLFINGQATKNPKYLLNNYWVWYNNFEKLQQFVDSLGNTQFNTTWSKENKVLVKLNQIQFAKFTKAMAVDSIQGAVTPTEERYWVYPKNNNFRWTIDNYGELVVPYSGMKIDLNNKNYLIYLRTIRKLEKVTFQKKNENFLINGVPATEYTFKNNYYFFMGDNRHNSADSRYWGFVPESSIVGKAVCILFSNNDSIKWNRILKSIHG